MSLRGDESALITSTSQIFSCLPLFTHAESLKNALHAYSRSNPEADGSAAGIGAVGARRVQWHRSGDGHRHAIHGHVHRLPSRIGFGAVADVGRQEDIEGPARRH